MLKQRVMTACVLALITLWVVLKLPVAGFGAVLLVVMLLCAWEWADLAGLAQPRGRLLYGVLVLAPVLAVWPLVGRASFVAGLMILVFAAWCGVLVWLWRYAGQPSRQDRSFVGRRDRSRSRCRDRRVGRGFRFLHRRRSRVAANLGARR